MKKKGIALVAVLFIVQIGFILTIAMLGIAKSDLTINNRLQSKYQELYYADSGINIFNEFAEQNYNEVKKSLEDLTKESTYEKKIEFEDISEPVYIIVTKHDKDDHYIVSSKFKKNTRGVVIKFLNEKVIIIKYLE